MTCKFLLLNSGFSGFLFFLQSHTHFPLQSMKMCKCFQTITTLSLEIFIQWSGKHLQLILKNKLFAVGVGRRDKKKSCYLQYIWSSIEGKLTFS